MTAFQERIIEIARTWIDTPYHHQASLKGIGADCVGLLCGVGKEMGIIPESYRMPLYDPFGSGETLFCELARFADHIPTGDRQPGDVLIISVLNTPSHVAIMTDRGMIHSATWLKRVVEHAIRPTDERKIHSVYRIRES